jgi:hypothetical protein
MDLSVPAAIVTAGGILKAPAEEFLKKISGPAGDELGLWLRDKVRDYRARNTTRTVSSAQRMLSDGRKQVREVPLRTLLPLLDGASIEDSAELAELWAALLANAADANAKGIPPIFPSILQQLTPFDATVLNRINAVLREGLPEDPLPLGRVRERERWGVRRAELALGESFPDQLEAAIDTLGALGLIEHEPVLRSELGAIFTTGMDELRLTALGRHFIEACSPPTVAGPAGS